MKREFVVMPRVLHVTESLTAMGLRPGGPHEITEYTGSMDGARAAAVEQWLDACEALGWVLWASWDVDVTEE